MSNQGKLLSIGPHDICCWTTSHYICALVQVCLCVVSDCVPTRRVPSTFREHVEKRGTGAATTITSIRSCSDFTYAIAQPMALLTGNTWVTWPALLGGLGRPSDPAGVTMEGHLACFARRARGPCRCHVDRLPGLLFSVVLMAL